MKKFKPPLETIPPKKLQAKMVSLEKIYQTFKEEVTAIIYKLFPKKGNFLNSPHTSQNQHNFYNKTQQGLYKKGKSHFMTIDVKIIPQISKLIQNNIKKNNIPHQIKFCSKDTMLVNI